jgi:hypothetical protein
LASARRKRGSMAGRSKIATHGHQDDDDDFMDPPPRSTILTKFLPPISRCTPISVSTIVHECIL